VEKWFGMGRLMPCIMMRPMSYPALMLQLLLLPEVLIAMPGPGIMTSM
jgi:hypothetical protein